MKTWIVVVAIVAIAAILLVVTQYKPTTPQPQLAGKAVEDLAIEEIENELDDAIQNITLEDVEQSLLE